MKIASRFLKRPENLATIKMSIDGEVVEVHEGDSVAATLLANSGDASRLSAMNTPRTAFCMMGVCFECLVEVDGHPNVQGCMISAQDGMIIRRQNGNRTFFGGRA